MKAAVYGLGSMGFGMAQSLLRAGHSVAGFDVNSDTVARFQAEGGADQLSEPDVVVVVVLNAAQLGSVLDQVLPTLSAGAVVIACPTVPPAFAKDCAARCAALGVHYLDAPISGGAAKAALGQLSIMASGSAQAFSAAKPALDAMAETVFELGAEVGAGSAMKAVNQTLAGIHIAAMAEAMTFGMNQGIAPAQIVEVITQCAGNSWMFENRAPHIVDADYSPKSQVNIWPKDLGIVQDIAADAGFDMPIVATALAQFKTAAEAGLGHEDDAAVAKVYAARLGVTLPE